MPFIYQEYNNVHANKLVILDIFTMQVVNAMNVNPPRSSLNYMHTSELGLHSFKIARTCNTKQEKNSDNFYTAAFLVISTHVEQVGRFKGIEFQFIYNKMKPHLIEAQQIGENQLLLSKECINQQYWRYIQDAYLISFFNQDSKIIGCQFIIKRDEEEAEDVKINLISDISDANYNNLYFYQSSVFNLGKTQFRLSVSNIEEYIIAISTRFVDSIIENQVFEMHEQNALLRYASRLLMIMKLPDFEYILTNSFEKLKKYEFF